MVRRWLPGVPPMRGAGFFEVAQSILSVSLFHSSSPIFSIRTRHSSLLLDLPHSDHLPHFNPYPSNTSSNSLNSSPHSPPSLLILPSASTRRLPSLFPPTSIASSPLQHPTHLYPFLSSTVDHLGTISTSSSGRHERGVATSSFERRVSG